MTQDSILVVDVGTSSVRAAVVGHDAHISHVNSQQVLPESPSPGLVEFDAAAMAAAALSVARRTLAQADSVTAVGITNQRASVVVWDRVTGQPIGPGIGWQDLRTVTECLVLQGQDIRLAPNLSATKIAWLLDQFDPDRSRDLCAGTVDSWIAWTLSEGGLHVTDTTNAALTGLRDLDNADWSTRILEALRIPASILPTVVDSIGAIGPATALEGAPLIAGLAGDQQSSLIGQGCVSPGQTKITFGTGGMLDLCIGPERPAFESRGSGGSFPIIARSQSGTVTWGIEAVMLTAGTNVEWLRDDLGIIETAEDAHEVASQCDHTDGVVYVPALLGLGTPHWDYGARSTLLGVTRGTGRPQIVRAVLEGVAHRAADLVEAAETDSGLDIGVIRIDGGMSANPTFVQAVANATRRTVEVSPEREATTLGAGFLAGIAVGMWADVHEVSETWRPVSVVEPTSPLDREQWRQAVTRAMEWYPDLSGLNF